MNKVKILFLFSFIWVCVLSTLSSFAAHTKDITTESTDVWAVTATAFKLVGEKDVRNIKLNWMQLEDADLYKIYRDGTLIGEAKGNTYDDYGLANGKTFTYYVEAFKNGQKVATSISQQASTFTPIGEGRVYDNLNGKYITKATSDKPQVCKSAICISPTK